MLGIAESGAGDVNGDGKPDILMASLLAGSFNAGAAYVVFNATIATASSAVSAAAGLTMTCTSYSYCGVSLAPAGDVNGDGCDDVIVSSLPRKGSVLGTHTSYLVYGRKTTTPAASMMMTSINLHSMDPSDGVALVGATLAAPLYVHGRSSSSGSSLHVVSLSAVESGVGYVLTASLPSAATTTAAPSVRPTRRPTTVRPSAVPSITPTAPSQAPTESPTGPSQQPTSQPTAPTLSPTTEPSTAAPTESPSEAPTVQPSLLPSVTKTAAPSFKPLVPQTRSPTESPSVMALSRRPFAVPTAAPSSNTSTDARVIFVQEVGVIVKSNLTSANYILNVTSLHGQVTVTGVGCEDGNTYSVIPTSGGDIIIEHFAVQVDVINLTAFADYRSLSDLNITRGSVLIHLPNSQLLKLNNIFPEDLTDGNFLFSKAKDLFHSQTRNAGALTLLVSGCVFLLVGLIICMPTMLSAYKWYADRRKMQRFLSEKQRTKRLFLFEATGEDIEEIAKEMASAALVTNAAGEWHLTVTTSERFEPKRVNTQVEDIEETMEEQLLLMTIVQQQQQQSSADSAAFSDSPQQQVTVSESTALERRRSVSFQLTSDPNHDDDDAAQDSSEFELDSVSEEDEEVSVHVKPVVTSNVTLKQTGAQQQQQQHRAINEATTAAAAAAALVGESEEGTDLSSLDDDNEVSSEDHSSDDSL